MIDPITQYLLEGYLMSDKTISIDMDKFISGESNKLIIAGLSGGGKSTLCRIMAKKPGVGCFETDNCGSFLSDLRSKADWDPKALPPKEVFKKAYIDCVRPRLKNGIKEILDGGIVWETYLFYPQFRKELNKYPAIIFGASSLRSSIQVLKRRKDVGKKTGPAALWKIFLRNFVQLNKMLEEFRRLRLKAGGEIKEFVIPKIKGI